MKHIIEQARARQARAAYRAVAREGGPADHVLAQHDGLFAEQVAQKGGAGAFLEDSARLRSAIGRANYPPRTRERLDAWLDGAIDHARQIDARELAEDAALSATPAYIERNIEGMYSSSAQVRANEGQSMWTSRVGEEAEPDAEHEHAAMMRHDSEFSRVVPSMRPGEGEALIGIDPARLPEGWRVAQRAQIVKTTFAELFVANDLDTAREAVTTWRAMTPEVSDEVRQIGRDVVRGRANMSAALHAHGAEAVGAGVTFALLDGVQHTLERAERTHNPVPWWPNSVGRSAYANEDALGRSKWVEARGVGGQPATRRELPDDLFEVATSDGRAHTLPRALAVLAYPQTGAGPDAFAISDAITPRLARGDRDGARALLDAMRWQTPEPSLTARADGRRVLEGRLDHEELVARRGEQTARAAVTHSMLDLAERALDVRAPRMTLDALGASVSQHAPEPAERARLDVRLASYNVELRGALEGVDVDRTPGTLGPWRQPTWQVARSPRDPDMLTANVVVVSADGASTLTYTSPKDHPADRLDWLAGNLGAPSAREHVREDARATVAQNARAALNTKVLSARGYVVTRKTARTPEQVAAFVAARTLAITRGMSAPTPTPEDAARRARGLSALARAHEIVRGARAQVVAAPEGARTGAIIDLVERAHGARMHVLMPGQSARGQVLSDPLTTAEGTYDIVYSTRGEYLLVPGGPRPELAVARAHGLTDVEVGPLTPSGPIPVTSADPRTRGAMYAASGPGAPAPEASEPARAEDRQDTRSASPAPSPLASSATAKPTQEAGARPPAPADTPAATPATPASPAAPAAPPALDHVPAPSAPSTRAPRSTARHIARFNRRVPVVRDGRKGGFASWQRARWQIVPSPHTPDRFVAAIKTITPDGTSLATLTPAAKPQDQDAGKWWAREYTAEAVSKLTDAITAHPKVLHPDELRRAGFGAAEVALDAEQRGAVERNRAHAIVSGLARRGSVEQAPEQAFARLSRALGRPVTQLTPGTSVRGSVLPTALPTAGGSFDLVYTRAHGVTAIPGGPRPELAGVRKTPGNDTVVRLSAPDPERAPAGQLTVEDASALARRPAPRALPSLSQALAELNTRLGPRGGHAARLLEGDTVVGKVLPERVVTARGAFHVIASDGGNHWLVARTPDGALDGFAKTPNNEVRVTRSIEGARLSVVDVSGPPSRGR